MHRWLAIGLAAMALLVTPIAARAQPAWDTPSRRGFELVPRSGANIELGFWTLRNEASQLAALSGLLRAGLVLDESFEIGLTAGWVWAVLSPVEGVLSGAHGDHGAAANPQFSFTGIFGERSVRLRLGGGFTIPATPTGADARTAAFFGSGIRGYSELWLWTADRGSLLLDVSLQLVPVEMLYLELSARGAGMFTIAPQSLAAPQQEDFIGEEDAYSNVDASIDLAAAIGIRGDNVLGGIRFRQVFNPTFRDDQAQSSLELFLRATGRVEPTSIELFGELRLLANLDDPYGVASRLPVFGVHFSFGISSTPHEIPDGRYGVDNVEFIGVEQVDQESIAACIGTRRRPRVGFDISTRGAPQCGETPFDGAHARVDLFSYPWSEWPLFDENVFERDIERIARWYRARGYYDEDAANPRVTSTVIDPESATRNDVNVEGCGDGEGHCHVNVTISIREGEPVLVERISIEGIDDLPEGMRESLRGSLQFQRVVRIPSDPAEGTEPVEQWGRFDEALYEQTKRQMLRVLADAGHGHAQVGGEVKINTRRREAYIVFIVDAGAPNVVGRVCITGNGELPAGPIIAVAGLEAGEPFSLEGLEEAQRALYALGVFSAVEVTPITGGSGEAAGVDDETQGDEAPDDESADDEAHSEDSTNRGETESVIIPDDAVCSDGPSVVARGREPVDILVRVRAGRRYRIGLGGGFQAGQSVTFGSVQSLSDDQNAAQWDLHLSLMLEDRNFLESMIRARFEVRPRVIFDMPFFNFSPAEPLPFGIQATGSLLWPGFIEPRTNFVVQTRGDLGPMPFTSFFRGEVDLIAGPERTFFDGRLYLGAFLHGNYFVPTDLQPLEPADELPQTLATYLEAALRLDLRDDPRNPTLGAFFAGSAQFIFGEPVISTWSAIRWNAEGRGYIPLGDRIVLAGRFSLGGMHVLGYDTASLAEDNQYRLHQLGPPSLQLRGGGASSNRGFLPGLLGDTRQVYVSEARSEEDVRAHRPIQQRAVRISGGTATWLASLEIRIRLTVDIGIVLFADVGDVIQPTSASDESFVGFRFDRPQLSLGIGLRYRTIIGPLRLDIALRPNEAQDLGQTPSLPPDCQPDRAIGCRPRNTLFGIDELPGAFHLTIGESF